MYIPRMSVPRRVYAPSELPFVSLELFRSVSMVFCPIDMLEKALVPVLPRQKIVSVIFIDFRGPAVCKMR